MLWPCLRSGCNQSCGVFGRVINDIGPDYVSLQLLFAVFGFYVTCIQEETRDIKVDTSQTKTDIAGPKGRAFILLPISLSRSITKYVNSSYCLPYISCNFPSGNLGNLNEV